MRYKVAIRIVRFLWVVGYDGLDTMFTKAFVQSNDGLNDPTSPKVLGVGKVDNPRQSGKVQEPKNSSLSLNRESSMPSFPDKDISNFVHYC